MNIFHSAPEFIDMDNRQARITNQVTAESTYNRLSAQLPTWFVQDNTILDLGSCLGAAGHMALTNGATHYTGVELQPKYVADSREIFSKYWPESKYTIVESNLEIFLDNCIANNIKFDCVIASGVLYTFVDIFQILAKIAAVSRKSLLIDTMYAGDTPDGRGIIIIREDINMVYAEGPNTFKGVGTTLSKTALDIILKTTGFYRTEECIIPPITTGSHDGYSDLARYHGKLVPARFAARYYLREKTRTLMDIMLNPESTDAHKFDQVPNVVVAAKETMWKFDESVASRFQDEATNNIPDYSRVIELCLAVAQDTIKKDAAIIDIGSALGYTVDKFLKAGFTNVKGLDNSESMLAKTLHRDRIILADTLPNEKFKLILMNWTFHFILEKFEYLTNLYEHLEPGGTLILSDKTSQSPQVMKMYYDFKLSQGVSQEYIDEKKKKLAGYMFPVPASWYHENLIKVGFTSVDVLNARVGFVTFVAKK